MAQSFLQILSLTCLTSNKPTFADITLIRLLNTKPETQPSNDYRIKSTLYLSTTLPNLILILTTTLATALPTNPSPSLDGETRSPNPHNNLLTRNNTIAAYRRIWVNCLLGPWGLEPNHRMMWCGFNRRTQTQDSYYGLSPGQCSTLCSCSCWYTPTCEQLHNCTGYMVMLACFDRSRVNTAGCYCDDGSYPFWKKGKREEIEGVDSDQGVAEVVEKDQDEEGLVELPVGSMLDPPKMTIFEDGDAPRSDGEMNVAEEELAPTLIKKAEAYITDGWPIPANRGWC